MQIILSDGGAGGPPGGILIFHGSGNDPGSLIGGGAIVGFGIVGVVTYSLLFTISKPSDMLGR